MLRFLAAKTGELRRRLSGRISRPLLGIWICCLLTLGGLLYWGGGAVDSYVKETVPLEQTASPNATGNSGRRAKAFPETPLPSSGSMAPPESPPSRPRRSALEASVEEPSRKPKAPGTEAPTTPPPPPLGRAAIVIDDFGVDLRAAERFASLSIPVTFSILPNERHSRRIAHIAHAQNREVILHMPMEPRGYPKVNPGKGALLLSMSDRSIRSALRTALDSHPYISGVNNHMGSRFTEDEAAMRVVLRELEHEGLYFLDSRTTPRSLGFSLAERLHMPAGSRDVFLDHEITETFVRSQIRQLIRKAKIQGSAIAIGHPHEVTYRVLRHDQYLFQEENIQVVPLGDLVDPEA